MNNADYLLLKELELQTKKATTALLEYGHTSDVIGSAADGLVTDAFKQEHKGKLTDEWRWLEALMASTRGEKEVKRGDLDKARASMFESQDWANRAQNASNVNTGHDVRHGQSKGGDNAAAPHRAKWPEYQAELDAMMARNTALSVTAAREKVAGKFNVSYKTILRNTTDPRKK